MSINSELTSIADKIRAIRGSSSKMGLDDMATNLGTVQTDLNNAFTAIGNKGGTIPSSKVSGNLVTAINTIPSKVTVQTKTGTFTSGTSSKPKVTVNCGFKPDTVRLIIPGEDYDVYPYEVTVDFNTVDTNGNCFALWSYDDTYFMWSVVFEQTSTGFTVDAYAWDGNWNSAYLGKTFQYTAKKYTE